MQETEYIHVKCDLCGSSETNLLMEVPGGAYHECRTCGLIYVNSVPVNYEQLNEQQFTDALSGYAEKIRTNRKRNRGKLKKFFQYRQTGNFLEIGCNAGSLLDVAREMGWNTRGVDLCETAADHACKKLGLDVFTGTVLEARYPDNYFDVIFTVSVLEHLRHPLSTLTECLRILRPGGVFYGETVNWDSYTRRLLKSHWKYLNASGHFHLYTPTNIRALCSRVGFEQVKIWSTGVRVRPKQEDFHSPWFWQFLKIPLSVLVRFTNKGDHIKFIARKADR